VGGTWTRPGWAHAKNAHARFIGQLHAGLNTLSYVRVFEMQRDRGVPHIHGLLAGLDSVRFATVASWYWKQYGYIRILEYDPTLGAAHYLTKYVLKEFGDLEIQIAGH
jgi:hypothetical protein